MKYQIIKIADWVDKSNPRVAILKEIYSGYESKFFLFPHVLGFIAAHSVDEDLTSLTGYSVLLKSENGIPLADCSNGDFLVFPY